MEEFSETFNNWIKNKVDNQLELIDKICLELDIDANEWFTSFKKRSLGGYTGDEFLHELFSNFIFYINCEFEKPLFKYFPPKGYNIYKEPYLSLDLRIKYLTPMTTLSANNKFQNLANDLYSGFYIKKQNTSQFYRLMGMLTLDQKEDLMKNKLFSHIVNQTKLQIFSKRDIRYLKLKKLKEYE